MWKWFLLLNAKELTYTIHSCSSEYHKIFALHKLEEQPPILLKSTHLTAVERIASATAGSEDLYRIPKCKV